MTNIVELLKDAPKGMKLYSPLFGEVEYCYIGGTNKRIWVCTKASMRMFSKDGRYCFTHDGNTIESTECLLFPNENCRTWVGWELPVKPNFKVGDWIIRNNGSSIVPIQVYDLKKDRYLVTNTLDTKGEVMLTRQDEWRLWNIEDATDGDVLARNWYEDGDSWEKIIIFKNYHAKGVKGLFKNPCIEGYGNTFKNGKLAFREEVPYYSKTWTVNLQPATAKQRTLLFKKIKEAGYQWDADKKELRKIQPHYDIANFRTGMPVLVREYDTCHWQWVLYSHFNGVGLFFAAGKTWRQCIPYEGNESLIGTVKQCDEQYINW